MKLAHESLCTIQNISSSWSTLHVWAFLITCEFSLLLPKLFLVLLGPKVWSAVDILFFFVSFDKTFKTPHPFSFEKFCLCTISMGFQLSPWKFRWLHGFKFGNMLILSQSHKCSQLTATLLLKSLVLSSWIRFTSLPQLQGTTQEASLA